MISALYIDERGPYANRDAIDAWGMSRDARRYAGPLLALAAAARQWSVTL